VLPDFGACLDGETNELSFGNTFGGIVFKWHCHPTEEWEKLGDFVNDLLNVIENIENN
jgi:hypothetical protein